MAPRSSEKGSDQAVVPKRPGGAGSKLGLEEQIANI